MARSYPGTHLKELKTFPPSSSIKQDLTSPMFTIYKSQVPLTSIPMHQHLIEKLKIKPHHASIKYGHEIKSQLQTTLAELESRAKSVRKALETIELEESYRESEVLFILIAKEKDQPAETVTKYFESTETAEPFKTEGQDMYFPEKDITQALSYDLVEKALAEATILLEY